MKQILECVPNISEGRDPAIIEEIVDQVRQAPGVRLIDFSSDADHNRSVLTYLGEPQQILLATQALACKIFELIDMRQHQGVHPRIGALDVVPFVPIRNMAMGEAVTVARQFGSFLGKQNVPVYYYEQAAARTDRRNLAVIRRGEYEGLAKKIEQPAWLPDEGPKSFNHAAGATVVGARTPLIAFNVNLETDEPAIARAVARTVRQSNGGLPHLKAIGLFLPRRNQVQVAMNLTDFTQTSLPQALEAVRAEAAKRGVAIKGTEIIGAIPLEALSDIARVYLQTADFSMGQVIESALL